MAYSFNDFSSEEEKLEEKVDNKIEEEVINIFRKTGIVNRKDAILCMKNKHRMKEAAKDYKDFDIIENLCPKYRSIYEKCLMLKEKGQIRDVWTYNGIVHMKVTGKKTENYKKILHLNDIEYYVRDVNFD